MKRRWRVLEWSRRGRNGEWRRGRVRRRAGRTTCQRGRNGEEIQRRKAGCTERFWPDSKSKMRWENGERVGGWRRRSEGEKLRVMTRKHFKRLCAREVGRASKRSEDDPAPVRQTKDGVEQVEMNSGGEGYEGGSEEYGGGSEMREASSERRAARGSEKPAPRRYLDR